MIHIGMDLHHRNMYLVAITDDGEIFPGRRIDNDRIEDLWQYLAQFGHEPKRVVFEATANSRWMRRLLQVDASVDAVAVTPHKVRIIAETIAKTDKIDATVLATLSKIDMLPRAWLPDEQVEDLRELTRHRAALVVYRTRSKNRVNAALVRRGLIRPYQNIFGTWGRQWLEQVDLPAVMRLEVDHWLETIDFIDERITQAEKMLYGELAKQDCWREDMALLMTVPGVGRLTALTILAELGDYRRFKRRNSVSCYVGLVPRSKRSDRSSRYGHISKRGSPAVRSLLMEVSHNAVRKVPRYGDLYRRVKAKKGANTAKTAVARQMIEDCWTLLIKREPFRLMPVQVESLTRAG